MLGLKFFDQRRHLRKCTLVCGEHRVLKNLNLKT